MEAPEYIRCTHCGACCQQFEWSGSALAKAACAACGNADCERFQTEPAQACSPHPTDPQQFTSRAFVAGSSAIVEFPMTCAPGTDRYCHRMASCLFSFQCPLPCATSNEPCPESVANHPLSLKAFEPPPADDTPACEKPIKGLTPTAVLTGFHALVVPAPDGFGNTCMVSDKTYQWYGGKQLPVNRDTGNCLRLAHASDPDRRILIPITRKHLVFLPLSPTPLPRGARG